MFNAARVDLRQTIIIVNDYARDDAEFASQISTAVNRDSPELETVETDVDLQTPRSADALLCRQTSPQLTRLTSSDQEDELDFDATAADHDDDEDEDEECKGNTG